MLVLLSSFIILYGCFRLFSYRPPPNFPLGPPQLPFVGNLHQSSLQKLYLKIADLGRKYLSHGLMGLRIIGPNIHVVPPGDYHLVDFLHESELEKRTPINEAESTQLMYELLVAPERFQEHVTRYYGAVFLASVFGTRAKEFGDNTVIKRFFDIQDDWSDVMAPGFVPPYDIFPFLEYVPEFLTPWRGWREKVQAVGQNQHAMYRELVAGVREKMAQGIGRECFMQDLLNGQEKDVYSDTDIEYFGGMLLEGGSDTTRNVFETFLLAMVAHPSILKKAQEEVDGIFGSDKIPAGTHNAKLPYLTACLLERRTLRWRPGFPSGIPHATTQDDIYEGFSIPANTTVILDIWGIHHDPDQFENPEVYDPTPFLRRPSGSKSSLDEISIKMAQRSLLLTAAKVVWCFEVEAVSLHEIDTSIDEFHGDMLMGPKRSQARFRVRGERRRRLIESEWKKADTYLKAFE
ncbi:cytochrome P450 [Xylaria longipes]|nr:cytochrome P450 [Xylaria longipes]